MGRKRESILESMYAWKSVVDRGRLSEMDVKQSKLQGSYQGINRKPKQANKMCRKEEIKKWIDQ